MEKPHLDLMFAVIEFEFICIYVMLDINLTEFIFPQGRVDWI